MHKHFPDTSSFLLALVSPSLLFISQDEVPAIISIFQETMKEKEEEGTKHSRSYCTAMSLNPNAWNLITWPHLNAKEDEKCCLYSMQPCALVKINESEY